MYALRRLLEARTRCKLGGKHALFSTPGGTAVSRRTWIRVICVQCRLADAGEHSVRQMAAQFLARLGVAMELIKFLGRWGSDAIHKYVENALEEQAARLGSLGGALTHRSSQSSDVGVPDVKASSAEGPQRAMGSSTCDGSVGRSAYRVEDSLGGLSGLASEAARLALQAWASEQSEATGGVVSAARDCRKRIHLVDPCTMTGWSGGFATLCGWTFGDSCYVRTSSRLASCKYCLARRVSVARQVGGTA